MDPSIVKLLEEDEDESMHSGADVDAFQAALNRDIEGVVSTSQQSDMDAATAVLPEGSNHSSNHSFAQWQTTIQGKNAISQSQQSLESPQQHKQHSSETERPQNGSICENQQQNDSQEPNHLSLQQNQFQDNLQLGQAGQNPSQIPQTTGMQISDKNPILTREPEQLHNQDSESQYLKLQKISNQQASSTEQPSNPMNRSSKPLPLGILLPDLLPQLDKDREMQLRTLYGKVMKQEISKDVFARHMKDIVGDQMLRLAVNKLQLQMGYNQLQIQSQASARQNHPRGQSVSAGALQITDPHSFAQLHQKTSNSPADPSHTPPLAVKMKTDSIYPSVEINAQKSQDGERQSDTHGVLVGQISSFSSSTVSQERESSSTLVQAINKQPQQHMQLPQTSFSMYGSSSGSYHPFSGTNVNTSASSLKSQPHDSQARQITNNQSVGSGPFGGATQPMNTSSVPKFERHNSVNDPNRVHGGSLSHLPNNSKLLQNSVPWKVSSSKEQSSGSLSSMMFVKKESVDQGAEQQQKSHSSTPEGLSAAQVEQGNAIPGTVEKQSSRMGFSTSTSVMPSNSVSPSMTTQPDSNVQLSSRIPSITSLAGVNARTPPKKPSIGQKKPLEALGSSPPPSSKKQKVSGVFSDQSIERLNDVTAVSGVNLREEEEQLFSGPKEDSRVSEASRRVVQEEEERLILQKTPLQKKLAEILTKCGLKNINNDVERCLSLCVEERMRGLICNIIRLSKQRVDVEKAKHRTIITSDVWQQITTMNRKAREEWEKKQAEAEKLRKLNEPEADNGVDGDKEKDEGRSKSVKVNKEEDDKMRTTAANVAARAAVGGDDMLSKWQFMAEQARQKREGGMDAAYGSQADKDVNRKPLSASRRNAKDVQEAERRGIIGHLSESGAVRKSGRNQVAVPQTMVARTVSVKDVIPVLEREPQMSRSTLIYRLYERICSESAAE